MKKERERQRKHRTKYECEKGSYRKRNPEKRILCMVSWLRLK